MSSLLRSLVTAKLPKAIHTRLLATAAEASSSTASTSTSAATASSPSSPEVTAPALDYKWTPFSRRVGILARKRGMTSLWDESGKKWPVTVLQVDDCTVIRHRQPHANQEFMHGIEVGTTEKSPKNVTAQLMGHFRAQGVTPKYRLKEYPVSPDAVLPVGTKLSAAHFVPGQYVDVQAKTIGKGFQGVMKRHGFRGQSATHGTSLKHRSPGAIGGNQDPGRVMKGKKMAGRMGGKLRTTQNLLVHRIDTALNLIYVRGAVPGADDAYVSVADAIKAMNWRAQKSFKSGKEYEEWLQEGVKSLPMPGVSVEQVQKAGWPKVIEWPGHIKRN